MLRLSGFVASQLSLVVASSLSLCCLYRSRYSWLRYHQSARLAAASISVFAAWEMHSCKSSSGTQFKEGRSERSSAPTATMRFKMTSCPHWQRRRPVSLGISEKSRHPSVQCSKAEKFIDTNLGDAYLAPQQGAARILTPLTIVMTYYVQIGWGGDSNSTPRLQSAHQKCG